VAAHDDEYSDDLDEVGKLLFPNLSQEERRSKITAVIERAQDEGRIDRIDKLASNDLYAVLLSELRKDTDGQ
jgi:hypothetical protein